MTEKVGEIMRQALMLMKTKRGGALEHANKMVDYMRKAGHDEDQDYWQKIVRQIEAIAEGNQG